MSQDDARRGVSSTFIGMAFQTGTDPVTVTHLGRYAGGESTEEHTLVLIEREAAQAIASDFEASGSSFIEQLDATNVTVDLGGQHAGDFVYTRLDEPVTLESNTEYVLVSSELGDDPYYGNVQTQTTADGMITTGVLYDDSNMQWGVRYGSFGTPQSYSWEAWQAAGLDVDSVVTDPRFRDANAGDFRLPDDSPATERPVEFEPTSAQEPDVRRE